jgi:hypothetical protein
MRVITVATTHGGNLIPLSNPILASQVISHAELREIDGLKTRRNARSHDTGQLTLIKRSMVEFGWTTPVLVDELDVILAGYGRVQAARELGVKQVPVVVARGWSEAQKKAYMLADNQIALKAGWDETILNLELQELGLMDFDLSLIGFDPRELKSLGDFGALQRPVGNLAESFILPPFSILDSKQGWWQKRKRAWLELGIQSELGRGDNALRYSDTILQPDPSKRRAKTPTAKVDLTIAPQQATPVEAHGEIWLKRDDLFEIADVNGGKVRTCWHLAQGAKGLVTAGSRSSPQVNIVAHIAKALGVPCRVHTPKGTLSPEVAQAQEFGAEVVQHDAGYNNVIIARAREDAKARGWTEIPFGMECWEAVRQTRGQFLATEIPAGVRRIVIPVGSGMSLAGLLHGLEASKVDLNVLGVLVGADPTKRLDQYAPPGWNKRIALIQSRLSYEKEVDARIDGVPLDSVYEAKCAEHLRSGDMLWCIGIRATQLQLVDRPIPGRAQAGAQGAQFAP